MKTIKRFAKTVRAAAGLGTILAVVCVSSALAQTGSQANSPRRARGIDKLVQDAEEFLNAVGPVGESSPLRDPMNALDDAVSKWRALQKGQAITADQYRESFAAITNSLQRVWDTEATQSPRATSQASMLLVSLPPLRVARTPAPTSPGIQPLSPLLSSWDAQSFMSSATSAGSVRMAEACTDDPCGCEAMNKQNKDYCKQAEASTGYKATCGVVAFAAAGLAQGAAAAACASACAGIPGGAIAAAACAKLCANTAGAAAGAAAYGACIHSCDVGAALLYGSCLSGCAGGPMAEPAPLE